jgi:hypothetical protein
MQEGDGTSPTPSSLPSQIVGDGSGVDNPIIRLASHESSFCLHQMCPRMFAIRESSLKLFSDESPVRRISDDSLLGLVSDELPLGRFSVGSRQLAQHTQTTLLQTAAAAQPLPS